MRDVHKSLIFICLGVAVVMSFTFALYSVLMRFTPQREMQWMLSAMSKVTSLSEETGVSWTTGDQTTTLHFLGPVDLHIPGVISHQTKFHVVRFSQAKNYTDLSGEIRSINGKTFLTYTPPGPTVPGVDFSKADTWISFQEGELNKWGSLFPNIHSPIEWAFEDEQTPWTPDSHKAFERLLSLADVFTVSFHGKTEIIQEQKTRLIDARFDEETLASFLLAVFVAKEGRDPTSTQRVDINEQAKELSRLTLQFWIGSKDHLLYRVHAYGGVRDGMRTEPSPVDMRMELSDFNHAFDISTPNVVTPFADLIRGTLSLAKGKTVSFVSLNNIQLPQQTFDEANDPDHDGLSTMLELFYLTNPHVADSDSDGMNDGDEVNAGRNPNGNGTLFGFGL